jgi:ABC-type uncharacterized transport system auxiliary subunit
VREGFINPIFCSKQMVYRLPGNQVNYFGRNQWSSSPSSMINLAVVEALQESQAFNTVLISPPFTNQTDLVANVSLFDLSQVFDATEQHAHLRLVLEITLADGHTNKILAEKRFSEELPTAPNPTAGAEKANQALNQMLPVIVRFITANING